MKLSSKTIAAVSVTALTLVGGATVAANANIPNKAPNIVVSEAQAAPAENVAPSAANIVTQNRIGTMASANAVRVAMETCQGQNLPFVTVALVDRFGTVHALLRGDNAAERTIEAAKEKAYTAAAFCVTTAELATRATGNGPGLADLPGTLFLPGGVPPKVKGVSVAGIGMVAPRTTCWTGGPRPPAQPRSPPPGSRLETMKKIRRWPQPGTVITALAPAVVLSACAAAANDDDTANSPAPTAATSDMAPTPTQTESPMPLATQPALTAEEQIDLDQELVLAAKDNKPDLVRELIAGGGSVNAKDSIQGSAFLCAGVGGLHRGAHHNA